MRRRTKVAIFCLLALAVVTGFLTYDRFTRVLHFREFMAHPGMVEQLSVEPQQLTPSINEPTALFDLGYASLGLPTGWEWAETSFKWPVVMIENKESGEKVVVFTPTWSEPDGGYAFAESSRHTKPLSSLEVFIAPKSDLIAWIPAAVSKTAYYNEVRISEFETERIKGFIGHGSKAHPESALEVWGKFGRLRSAIFLYIHDQTERDAIANCIAATFQYKLDDVPSDADLSKLTSQAVDKNNQQPVPPVQDLEQ